jgi:hypothetical protein
MASVTKEQITAALKKLGPSKPGEVADHLGADYSSGMKYTVKSMLDAGELKAIGATVSRRIALPDQKFDEAGAPPQERQKPAKRKGGRKAKHARKPRSAPAPRTSSAAAVRFIPTVDADKRLHIINGSDPVSFSDAQTEAIATLLLQHYAP